MTADSVNALLDLVSRLGVSLGEPTARPWLRTARRWGPADGPRGLSERLGASARPLDLEPLMPQGTVRWFDDGKGVGVEFTAISPTDQQALQKFISSQTD